MDNLPEVMFCKEHGKVAKLKVSEKFGSQYSHSITYDPATKLGTWCNKKPEDFEDLSGSEQVREPVKQDQPDWDGIARGKVRHGVAVAFIEKVGVEAIRDEAYLELMEAWTDFIMSGKP